MTAKTTVVPSPKSFVLTWDHVVFLVILGLSIITRLWGLGDRALHHDETLHADYSYSLFAGLGFVHDPLLHGPFLYVMGAVGYFFFGDNDATARISPALFSIALGLTPYLLRREIGRTGAIVASIVMLASPVFLYIGRFFRHDIYTVLFEVLVVIAIIRYARSREPQWLIVGAVALSLMLTTLETTYLFIAIFLPVIVAVFFWQVWRPGFIAVAAIGLTIVSCVFVLPGKAQPAINPTEDITISREIGTYVCPSSPLTDYVDNPIQSKQPGPIFGLGPLETVDNMYALCVRNQSDNDWSAYFFKLWQFFRHPAILAGLLLTIGGGVGLWYMVWKRVKNGTTLWQRALDNPNPIITIFASLASSDNRVLNAVGLAIIPYVLFFSAFFYNPVGIISGTTGSLLYWLAQHNVKRGGQPNHYYGVMLAVYEPLVVIAGLASAILMIIQVVRVVRAGRMPSAMLATGMLFAWWSLGSFAIFSWAGEKMPWLTIHPLTPLTFLAAWGVGQLIDMWIANHRQQSQGKIGLVTVLGMSAILGFVATILMMNAIRPDSTYAWLTPWIPVGYIVLVAVIALAHIPSHGKLWSIGMLVFALSGTLALYEIRSAWRLSYISGDTPKEMMIYTQTTPDALRVIHDLTNASMSRSGDMSMPIWHDNETVWDWYMRHFTNKAEQPPGAPAMPGEDIMAIVVLDENLKSIDDNTLPGFLIQKYPLRWWFPEDQMYRLPAKWYSDPIEENASLLTKALRQPFDSATAVATWRYYLYRDTGFPLGSSDFYVAIRPEIAPYMSLGLGAR
jgi:predicted membrane-bound mannosyltransferase